MTIITMLMQKSKQNSKKWEMAKAEKLVNDVLNIEIKIRI